MIEHHLELVPRKRWQTAGERQGIEAVVPAPNLVHPVLGHENGGSTDESRGEHSCRPKNVSSEFCGRGGFVAPRRDRVDEVGKLTACRHDGFVETPERGIGGPGAFELLIATSQVPPSDVTVKARSWEPTDWSPTTSTIVPASSVTL